MKFTAKKARQCTDAGEVYYEFDTDDLEDMCDYIITAFSYGSEGDRRDNDYVCIYDHLSEFEAERFVDNDDKQRYLANYAGITPYADLPRDSKLLYISSCCNGWDLVPVNGPRDIIMELIGLDWSDLTIDFEN